MTTARMSGDEWVRPHNSGSLLTAGLRHEAFTYSGADEFVQLSAGFLLAGIAAGQPGALIGSADRVQAVRAELGPAAADVRFVDTDSEARNPAVVLSVLQRLASEYDGRRVRALAELVRPAQPDAVLAEAQLHELLLNTPVCRDWNMWLACPYDSANLRPDLVESMHTSHPPTRADLTNLVAEKFSAALPPRPDDAERFDIDGRDLATVRTVVRTAALMTGLNDERADGFVYAVNEVVSNSIRHGDGVAKMALWLADRSLVCEVTDGGHLADVLAGRLQPALDRTGGRGLWLVNHLCDLVQVRSPESGTAVRMHIEI